MTLRLKLALALVIATLLPMGVAVGAAMLRAERRAAEDASRRLEAARRRAAFLIDRYSAETAQRLERAADDLARDASAPRTLLRAESRPASSELARALASRAGLDELEILSAEGTTLSSSRQDASTGLRSAFADLREEGVAVRVVPRRPAAVTGAADKAANETSSDAGSTEPSSQTDRDRESRRAESPASADRVIDADGRDDRSPGDAPDAAGDMAGIDRTDKDGGGPQNNAVDGGVIKTNAVEAGVSAAGDQTGHAGAGQGLGGGRSVGTRDSGRADDGHRLGGGVSDRTGHEARAALDRSSGPSERSGVGGRVSTKIDRGGEAIFVYARRRAATPAATFYVAGGREVGNELIATIAAVSGEPAALLDASGAVVLASGDEREAAGARETGAAVAPREDRASSQDHASPEDRASSEERAATTTTKAGEQASGERISTDIPLGDSRWRVRVSIPSGDVRHTRAELLAIFAGIAPFALASALAVGLILAEGISRPIRALTSRAETIARERAGPLPLPLLDVRDEVMRLTLCFDQMLDALSESERQRIGAERIAAWQEVAQRIAHEVKNPLSPIKLAVENLRRMRATGAGDFDRAFEEESISILEEVESLRRLVDEFSQFVRLPRPRLVPCDLRELVAQTRALFAPKLEDARVRVDVDDAAAPSTLAADPEQLGRVLKNVLANAIEALEGARDRSIRITLREERDGRGGPSAVIEVRDSGAGLSAEAQRRIFEPYFTTRPDRGGTGLGMAICYRIVTEHGGTIRAEGAPGRGATITIRLPLDRGRVSGDESEPVS